ncbi:MAG TPA: ATP-binding protein [Pseudonocardiaceae bacterium]|jgi:two-component system OmpR family sensor kinase
MSALLTRAGKRVAGWPLLTRLLITLLALLAVVCLVVGGISVLALQRFLVGRLDDQLGAAAMRSSSAFGAAPLGLAGPPGLPAPGLPPQRPPEGPRFLLAPGQTVGTVGAVLADGWVIEAAVLDPDGVARPLAAAQDPVLGTLPPDGRPRTRQIGRQEYRLVAAPAPDGAVLVIGLPLQPVNAILARLTGIEVLVAVTALVVAGAAGVLIVSAALRPLQRMAATAGRVAELPLDRGEVALAERVPAADTDPRTEVGQVGAALNHMLSHVAAALQARQDSETQVRQFVADASHELRTPLAAIRGYAELIERRGDAVPPEVAQALLRSRSQTERMTSLVEDMLLLARLDTGRALAREPVDLTRLVVDAVSDAHVAGPGHRFILDLPDEPVTVTGDEMRLGQVLANLLANARTHTPSGSTVTIGLTSDDAEVRLRVSDDGPGIPADLMPHVFERFARADASRSRVAGSTGLGLAIVHAVVVAHGGTVAVHSAPGRTVFTVLLHR